MKHLKYLLLICLAAAAACSKDKTEDPTLKAQRTALQETQAVGIYRSGEALRLFDKAKSSCSSIRRRLRSAFRTTRA